MKHFSFLALCASMLVLFGCEKAEQGGGSQENPDTPKPEDKISVNPSQKNFPASGDAITVTVTSSGDWTLTSPKEDWVKASATKGKNGDKVTFTAIKNTATTTKGPVEFVFTVGKKTAKFTATQEAGTASFTPSYESWIGTWRYTAPGLNDNVNITITAKTDGTDYNATIFSNFPATTARYNSDGTLSFAYAKELGNVNIDGYGTTSLFFAGYFIFPEDGKEYYDTAETICTLELSDADNAVLKSKGDTGFAAQYYKMGYLGEILEGEFIGQGLGFEPKLPLDGAKMEKISAAPQSKAVTSLSVTTGELLRTVSGK